MKVSRLWLQKFFDAPLPDADKLADALTFHAFEIDGIEKVGDDEVLDVKVTPNRGHDCLSHRGIAKELSAILKIPLAHDPFDNKSDIAKKTGEVSVTIENPELCRRYIAGYIKGVKVGPSPKWLQERLGVIGQKSINNVVDATNFVMFNTGQPLHAFDARRLGGLRIGVRLAKDGEEMEALDKKKYPLKSSILVITAENRPVGIAGIKGGMADKIDEATTDIVVESANFDGVTIRKSSQLLKLRTDASSRFEQGMSPELAACGMENMVEFIQHMLGGEIAGFVDVFPEPQEKKYVSVTTEKVNKVLGTELTGADVADAFIRLRFAYKEQDGVFEVQPPFERLDLEIPEDLVEEVARIVGYDTIPAIRLPSFEKQVEINKHFAAAEEAREKLQALGYSEVYTSVFADKGERVVLNKVDGVRPYLRDSLLPGLTDALIKNKPNKDLLGLKEIRLFEIGTVWKGGKEMTMIGMVSEKESATEMLLVGQEKPTHYEDLPLSSATRYQTFSKYPYIVRDVAFWVPKEEAAKIYPGPGDAAELFSINSGGLLKRVHLFDQFEDGKNNRVSFAFRLVFQSFEKTLTEVEVNAIMEKIYAMLKEKGFEIR